MRLPPPMTLTIPLILAAGAWLGLAAGKEKDATPMKTDSAAPQVHATPAYWQYAGTDLDHKVVKSDEEWKKLLTPLSFNVARQAGTERAFTGATWDNHEHGIYRCVACGLEIFGSETKFDSGTGWPSFWQPIAPERVATKIDSGFFMSRTEVLCPRCGSHLGHVFNDGPKPTGLRYCMNSAALWFEKK